MALRLVRGAHARRLPQTPAQASPCRTLPNRKVNSPTQGRRRSNEGEQLKIPWLGGLELRDRGLRDAELLRELPL